MSEIGNLRVTVDADTAGLERGSRRGQRELNQLSSGMERAAGIATRLAGVLAAVGVGIGFSQAIREIANFQSALNGLAAVSNATAQQMETLEKQARTLGATSQFSAQQAAEAQRFLAQAGFEVNEVMGATPGILQLATAAQLDLGSAADIASNVLGGMRLEVDQLGRVNDVLAATASRSNTNIQQLGQALSFAAPFAAGAGVSIEEAAAAIGNMSDAGIQASRAGTGLVGVIRQLSNVTSGGEDVLSQYGLSIADVSIEARGLGPVLETLRGVNLNTADAIALFGSEAGAAAQVLVNDYSGAIEDASGESERMARQLEQGLGPAFKSLQSAVSESVLQMGDSGLAGALEGAVRAATGVVNTFNGMSDQFTGVIRVAETLTVLVGARLVAAMGGYAASVAIATQQSIAYQAALARMAGVSRTAAVATGALRGALALVGGPLGLLVGAGGLLFLFREELGLIPKPAATVEQHLDDITSSVDGLNDAMLDLRISAFGAELVQLGVEADVLASKMATLDRVASEPTSFGQGMQGDIREGASRTQAQLDDTQNRIEAIKQGMEEINNLRRGERGGDSEETEIPGDAETPTVSSPTTDNDKLGEHLRRRIELLREANASEVELLREKQAEEMEAIQEAREAGLDMDVDWQQLERDTMQRHEEELSAIHAREEESRRRMTENAERAKNQLRASAVDNAAALLNTLGQKNKAFALASIALTKGMAITQTLAHAQTAAVLAFSSQLVPGDPSSYARAAAAYQSTQAMGAVSAGLIAAQGLAQAAGVLNGSGGSSASAGGGTGGSVGGSAPGSPSSPATGGGSAFSGTLTVEGVTAGSLFSGDQVRELAEELLQYQRRGGQVVIQ